MYGILRERPLQCMHVYEQIINTLVDVYHSTYYCCVSICMVTINSLFVLRIYICSYISTITLCILHQTTFHSEQYHFALRKLPVDITYHNIHMQILDGLHTATYNWLLHTVHMISCLVLFTNFMFTMLHCVYVYMQWKNMENDFI